MERLFSLLIVEDDPLILQALAKSHCWPEHGYRLAGAVNNAEEALALATRNPPDVVLTDICMNGLSGLDLIERLHDLCPEMMYVILSGYSEFEYAHRALRLGVFEYLTKPIDDAQFHATFARLYERLMEKRQQVDSIKTACGEFVTDILNREMDAAYLKERLLTLKMQGGHRWYRVILLEGGETDSSALAEQFGVPEWQCAVLGVRHVLIWGSNTGDVPDALLQRYLQAHPGMRAGVGGRQKLPKLCQSRQEAEWALDALFFTGQSMNASGTMPRCDRIALNRYADAVVQAWMGLDETVMKAATGDYFRFVRSQGAERDKVLINITHILIRLLSKMREGQRFERDVEILQAPLMSAFTVDQLERRTTELLIRLQKEFRCASPAVQDSLAGRACAYIDAHIEQRITLSDIAADLFINASYLSRTFKQTVGDNINHYITHKKITRATEDMRNLNLSLRQIAYRLGFADYTYFCVQFKKETGETPLNYRKRLLYGGETEKKT